MVQTVSTAQKYPDRKSLRVEASNGLAGISGLSTRFPRATELGTELILEQEVYPQMFVERKPPLVVARPPVDQFSLLVLLHELAHVELGHTQSELNRFYFDNGVLRSEAQAWELALEVLGEDLEDDTRRQILLYLHTYLNESALANGQLWHIYRPALDGESWWQSPAFRFDPPDYCLQFLAKLEQGGEIV